MHGPSCISSILCGSNENLQKFLLSQNFEQLRIMHVSSFMVYMDHDVRLETSSASKSESDGYYFYGKIFNLLTKQVSNT
jgi:hypothetical protein